ncbi:MAG: DUF5067 domain-containing protein [Coriobacteriaceae bacterium]|nr:DUF5067 domain-containing protein [Coriobacteriaceae bacterium]
MHARTAVVSKRVMTIALVPALAFASSALIGCGSSSEAAGSGKASSDTAQEQKAKSDYVVTIDNCTVTADYEGAPAIIVDYTFTNNSDEATSFAAACDEKAFQNGVQLEMAILTEDLGNGYMAEIKPGASTTARLAYSLTDQSEVLVEVGELFSLEDTLLAEKTFTVA